MVQSTVSLPGVLGSPLQLVRDFPELVSATQLLVAYSGGLDSTVLLHLLTTARDAGLLPASIQALHVNHGLQAQANSWQVHCENTCKALNVTLEVHTLALASTAARPVSEGRARDSRYAGFEAALKPGGILLQAHHQQDQAETIMFRLLRGTGLKGLAGIPVSRPCGAGKILRPLLTNQRADLLAYARNFSLQWIEDPSNGQIVYSRNFLRQQVLPVLYKRWPDLGAGMALTAVHCEEAAQLLEEVALEDLERLTRASDKGLSIAGLLKLSANRRNNALRYWYQHNLGVRAAPLNQSRLENLYNTVVQAVEDAAPQLLWGEGENQRTVRRFQQWLYLVPSLPQLPTRLVWQPGQTLTLPPPMGSLDFIPCDDQPALYIQPDMPLEVRFRQGGEQAKLPGRPTRPLKKLLQEWAVPPWLRDRIPLIYQADVLLAIGDWYTLENAPVTGQGQAMKVVWKHPDLHCGS